ncbi:hypothetical protein WJX74_004225 [Apatococcus lobatus]|uniref:Uncharacterized protein n=2 Tax=Apatococcus TaxID=904362 RepID=A0AAW1SNW4_9CHLO
MLQRFVKQAVSNLQDQRKQAEKGVQQVVEVLAPGPLGGSAKAWNTKQREAAKAAVEEAVSRWKQLDAQQPK